MDQTAAAHPASSTVLDPSVVVTDPGIFPAFQVQQHVRTALRAVVGETRGHPTQTIAAARHLQQPERYAFIDGNADIRNAHDRRHKPPPRYVQIRGKFDPRSVLNLQIFSTKPGTPRVAPSQTSVPNFTTVVTSGAVVCSPDCAGNIFQACGAFAVPQLKGTLNHAFQAKAASANGIIASKPAMERS